MDVIISDVSEVYIKVDCDRSIAKELSDFFTFLVPNYQYTPAYQKKKWDGKIRLFNLHARTLYKGLLDYVIHFCKDRKYTCELKDITTSGKPISEDDIEGFIDYLKLSASGNDIVPHPHQIDAVLHSIRNGRSLMLSPTGSGKSLIIYIIMRYYLDILPNDKKVLIIVPTTGLVSQLKSDFNDYSNNDRWDAENNIHCIFSGQAKSTDKRVVISTWQSLYKLDPKFFYEYDVVFGDECHLFQAKSLTSLMSKLTHIKYRFGTSGTLDGSKAHKLVIEGLFGRVFKTTTTVDLIEKDLLSNLDIECVVLKYTPNEIQTIKRATYHDEMDWLLSSEKRNNFLCKLTESLDGNTLMLFNYVDKHGIPLYNKLKEMKDDVYLIYGQTAVEQREEIRQLVNNHENSILVASYGTCSTGINIQNIHNIIFTSSSKSVIRVLQSIGRGLRKSSNKDKVKVYDIADDLSYKKWRNHTLKHLDERVKIYTNENFRYRLVSVQAQ
jgi:superfamily II DNA or RNA helicase